MAGVGIGCADTAEAAVAALAPEALRGSAFGLLAALQSLETSFASAVGGVLYTAVSPAAAFMYAAALMAASQAVLPPPARAPRRSADRFGARPLTVATRRPPFPASEPRFGQR